MEEDIKSNLGERSTWMRALYMIMFAIIYSVTEVVITLVVLFQFFSVLITGGAHARVLKLGQSLATYIYQMLQFLTFNSDVKPYPFGAWPKGEPTKKDRRVDPDEKDVSGDINQNLHVDGK